MTGVPKTSLISSTKGPLKTAASTTAVAATASLFLSKNYQLSSGPNYRYTGVTGVLTPGGLRSKSVKLKVKGPKSLYTEVTGVYTLGGRRGVGACPPYNMYYLLHGSALYPGGI